MSHEMEFVEQKKTVAQIKVWQKVICLAIVFVTLKLQFLHKVHLKAEKVIK